MAEDKKTRAEQQADEAVDYAVEGNDLDGFVGVSHEYRTYSDDTAKPVVPEDKEDAYKRAQRVAGDNDVEFNRYGQDAGKAETEFSSGPAVDESGERVKPKAKTADKPATSRTAATTTGAQTATKTADK